VSEVDAWSLTNITGPSGSIISYLYESNDYDWEQNSAVTNANGGGIRIKSKTINDGLGNVVTYNYDYEEGVATFIPKNESMYLEGYSAIGRHSRIMVEYKNITKTIPNYGSIKTEFTTSYDQPDTDTGKSMDYRRGLAKTIYYRDTSDVIEKQIDSTYSFSERSGFSDPYVSGIADLIQTDVQLEGVTSTTNYEYNSNNLISKITENAASNRITVIDYEYESNSDLADKNMLTQIDEVKIYKNDLTNLESKLKILYKDFCTFPCSGEQFYPDFLRVWNDTATPNNYIQINYDAYDVYGNLKTIIDAEGNTYETRYDAATNAYPIKGWNSVIGSEASPAWELAYDEFGNVNSSIDANDQEITSEYDDFARIKDITYPGETTATIGYDYYLAEDNGGLSASNLNYVNANYTLDNIVEMEFYSYSDGLGRGLYAKLENGTKDVFTKTDYDDIGLVNRTYEPYAATDYTENPPAGTDFIDYTYESSPLLRLSTIDPPDNGIISYSYSSVGNDLTATITDENNKQITAYINLLGNLVKLTDSDSNDITATHDILGNPLTITNQDNQIITNTFDDLGRLLSSDNVDSGTITLSYDDNSNLMSFDDAQNSEITFTYDGLDRVTDVNYPTDVDTSYTYDSYTGLPAPPAGLNNPEGRLTSISDNAGSTHYYYDVQGRLGQSNKTIDSKDYIKNYVYDSNDNLISMTDTNGRETNYTYNKLNQITSIIVDGTTIATYIYNSEGTIQNAHFGTGSFDRDYTYNNRNQLQSIDIHEGANTKLQRYFEYDDAGNLIDIYNDTSPTASKRILNLTYDNLYRLTEFNDFNDYLGDNYSFTYDKIGNTLSKTVGAVTTTYTYFNGTNKLKSDGSFNYTYDANANRISKINADTGEVVMNYSYDESNKLTAVNFSDGTSISFTYDSGGSLIKKIDKYGIPIYFYGGESQVGSDKDKFIIQNESGSNAAWFGNLGNIVLKGQCSVQASCVPSANSFIIKDNADNVVAYVNSTGDLCIESGDCSDLSASCNPTNDAFIVRNSNDKNMSYIDNTGDLCLTGNLIQNGSP